MKGIIDYLREVWDIPLAQDIVLILVTALITHFFESRKRKKDQKQKFNDVLGEKIAISLDSVRNVVVKTMTVQVYEENDTVSTDEVDDIYGFRNLAWYPEFMNDKDSFLNFCSEISSLRSKYEQNLDLKSAAYLYGLERYLMSLALYINKNDFGEYLPEIGCFVILDIKKWESKFDLHLVKRINKPHYKIFSRNSIKWRIAMWYIEKSFLDRSELNKVMKGKSDFPIEALKGTKERTNNQQCQNNQQQ